MIGSVEAAEALKILIGHFEQVSRKLLVVDLWSNDLQWLDLAGVRERADCPCCRHRRFEYLDGRAGSQAATLCGRNAVQLRHRQEAGAVDLEAVAERLGRTAEVRVNQYLLRATVTDQGGEFEITLFADGRAIVKGTDRPDVARSLYARHVGT
jgi:adenylyltransferase/sulfurtransferase